MLVLARRSSNGASLLQSGDVEQNPGPELTANATSLKAQMEAVLALPAHIMALQEVRLGVVAQQHMEKQLCNRGWQSFWGKPQPLREGQHGASAWNAMPGGVGFLVKEGIPARIVPPEGPAQLELWETGRWCHLAFAYGSGKHFVP